MKKMTALLLACSMVLCVISCCSSSPKQSSSAGSPSSSPAPGGSSEPGASKTYKVGFSNVWVGNTYGVQSVNELEAFLKNCDQVSEYYSKSS